MFRGGDAANFAIGQGDVSASPLQMVRVYAAIANGGTVWTPHVGKAIVSRPASWCRPSPRRRRGPRRRVRRC